jgi:hypothetical protein
MSDYTEPVVDTPEPAPAPQENQKKKREGKKLSDKQKADLNRHMDKMKKGGMTLTEQRSMRMKMMSQLRKDPKMSVNKAHKAISK